MTTGIARYVVLLVILFSNSGISHAETSDRDSCLNYTRLKILQIGLPGIPAPPPQDCERQTRVSYHCISGVTSIPTMDLQLNLPADERFRVVSIGEGYAGMVEYIRNKNVPAVGIDYDDGYRTKVNPLLAAHPEYYSWGDATQLSSHPLVNEGALDLVLSHCMLCAMPAPMAQSSLVEAARSLSVGGEARFSYYPHNSMEHDTEFLGTLLRGVAVEAALHDLNIEINVAAVNLFLGSSQEKRTMRLIRLRRYGSEALMPLRDAQCSTARALGEAPLSLKEDVVVSDTGICRDKIVGF